MVKSGARLLEQPTNIPTVHFRSDSEMNFSASTDEAKETTVIKEISEKFVVNVRYSRLKRRMRNRSSSIF